MIKETLPGLLKEFRKRANLTINEVGEKVGKSGKTISAWECGRAQPDVDTLLRLCEIYGVQIEDFYSENRPSSSFELSDEEKQLIEDYRASSEEIKTAVKMILGVHREKAEQPEELFSSAG